MVAVTDMVDFSEALDSVAVSNKVLGQGDGFGQRSSKVSSEIINAERGRADAGQQRIARRGAEGLVAIRVFEEETSLGEAIEVWRLNPPVTITAEQRFQVIDTNEQYVRPGGACGRSRPSGGGDKNQRSALPGSAEFHSLILERTESHRKVMPTGCILALPPECARLGRSGVAKPAINQGCCARGGHSVT